MVGYEIKPAETAGMSLVVASGNGWANHWSLLGCKMKYLRLGKRSISKSLAALALMAVSAYCTIRWFVAGALVSKRVGMPDYSEMMDRAEAASWLWGSLGLALPFLAALLLGLRARGVGDSAEPVGAQRWAIPEGLFGRLLLSALGTLGFILFLVFVSFLHYRLGMTTR